MVGDIPILLGHYGTPKSSMRLRCVVISKFTVKSWANVVPWVKFARPYDLGFGHLRTFGRVNGIKQLLTRKT